MDELDHGGKIMMKAPGVSSAPADQHQRRRSRLPPLWMMYSQPGGPAPHRMEALPDDGVQPSCPGRSRRIELFEIHCGGLRLANRRILGAPHPPSNKAVVALDRPAPRLP